MLLLSGQPSRPSVSGLLGGCCSVCHCFMLVPFTGSALLHSLISLLPLFHLTTLISRHLHSLHCRCRGRALPDPSPRVLCQPLVAFLSIALSHLVENRGRHTLCPLEPATSKIFPNIGASSLLLTLPTGHVVYSGIDTLSLSVAFLSLWGHPHGVPLVRLSSFWFRHLLSGSLHPISSPSLRLGRSTRSLSVSRSLYLCHDH
jgi:hypothetical protein